MTSTTIKVNVKWKKEIFKDVEVCTSEPATVFQTQLWTLTGVPPERQTVLLKGGKLRETTDMAKAVKPNMTIMMMGTPDSDKLPPPPSKSSVRNDLDATAEDAEYSEPPPNHPPGLINMGNTCYMNATVQCLSVVGPLRSSLSKYSGRTNALSHDEKVSAALRDLFSRLRSRNTAKLDPSHFLAILRAANPQFAERGGPLQQYLQQDAEECFNEILSRLASTQTPAGNGEDASNGASSTADNAIIPHGQPNRIDQLFAIETEDTYTCTESEEEPSTTRSDSIRFLKCHISKEVNHLNQGIAEGLDNEIEKHSEKLGRTAKWKRSTKLKKIPPFLIVQFVRFFWKPVEQVKAKILRNVSFPLQLDLYDYCTDELKKELDPKRAEVTADKEGGSNQPTPMDTTDTKGANEASSTANAPVSIADDISEPPAEVGNYELCAVLTHKGRTADSGHYVAWVKDSGTRWHKFDDDVVTVQTDEDVKKLSGGGDWHMNYMCVYRAKNSF